MSNNRARSKSMGAWLASTLIAVAYAVPASHAGDTNGTDDPSGYASIVIEGVPEGAVCLVDDHVLSIPIQRGKSLSFVVKSGRHVIEVHEGERVVLREEVSLKPGESRSLRVPEAE